MPAAVSSTSMRPHFSMTWATPARAWASLLTSAGRMMALPPPASMSAAIWPSPTLS